MDANITVRCVACGKTRIINADYPGNDMPMCDADGMPMVAISAAGHWNESPRVPAVEAGKEPSE